MFEIQKTSEGGSIARVKSSQGELEVPCHVNHSIPITKLSCCCCSFNHLAKLVFPEESNVLIIDSYAFAHCKKLITIIFPNSLIQIGIGAFYNCTSLNDINFRQNESLISIQDKAFMKCSSILNFIFPKSLKEIGEKAFYRCSKLKNVSIEDTNVQKIGKQAFSLTNVKILKFPEKFNFLLDNLNGLPTIGNEVKFSATTKNIVFDCNEMMYYVPKNVIIAAPKKIKNLKIRESTEQLLSYSFANCQIRRQAIPSSVKEIHENAFSLIRWRMVNFQKNSQLRIIHEKAFNGSYIKKIVLPPSLEIIKAYAFIECDNLQIVVFPLNSELKTIGFCAFKGTSIQQLSLPSKVDDLRNGSFMNMNLLKKLSICSKKYKSDYGGVIFSHDSNTLVFAIPFLQEIFIPKFINIIGSFSFSESRIRRICIPKSVKVIERHAFSNCRQLEIFEFEEGSQLEEICDSAFSYTEISHIDFPPSVNNIHLGAFYVTYSLKSITLNNEYFYTDKNGVVYAVSPPGIVHVPYYSKDFVISNDIVNIYDNAINYSSVTHIHIPKTVKYIGCYAFAISRNIAKITFDREIKLKKFNEGLFHTAVFKTFYVPESIEVICSSFISCKCLEEIHFHRKSKLKCVDHQAFNTLQNLRYIYLPRRIFHLFIEADVKDTVQLIVYD